MSINDVPGWPDYFYSASGSRRRGAIEVDVVSKASRRIICTVQGSSWDGEGGIHASADYALRTITREEAGLLECGCPAQYVADHGDHQEGCKWCNEDPPRFTREHPLGTLRDAQRAEHEERYPEQGGSRKDSPLAGRADTTEAEELLGRLKADGMLTQTADGRYHLRTYGRQALTALSLIMLEEEGVVRHEQP
jgi:hypothetical protein